jgi:hypothetical protein
MSTSQAYICDECGRTHEGLPTDRAYRLPDVVWAVPEAQRPMFARWTSDLCETRDGRFFIRCLLKVPFSEMPGYFGWGVWVQIDRSVFERYVALYDSDATGEPPAIGVLANHIPFYPDANGATAIVHFGSATQRPTLKIEGSSTLAIDQRYGIDNGRYHAVLRA